MITEVNSSHGKDIAAQDWHAFQLTVICMFFWAAMAWWNWRSGLIGSGVWLIKLGALIAICCMAGFKAAFWIGVDPSLMIRIFTNRGRALQRVLPFIIAVIVATVVQFGVNRVIALLVFGFFWGRTGLPSDQSIPFLIQGALQEEIVFRLLLFCVVLTATRRAAGVSSAASFWAGNVVQASIFGAAHVFENRGLFSGSPWYFLIAAPQTYGGLILGYVFYYYGIEAAVAVHALGNILVIF